MRRSRSSKSRRTSLPYPSRRKTPPHSLPPTLPSRSPGNGSNPSILKAVLGISTDSDSSSSPSTMPPNSLFAKSAGNTGNPAATSPSWPSSSQQSDRASRGRLASSAKASTSGRRRRSTRMWICLRQPSWSWRGVVQTATPSTSSSSTSRKWTSRANTWLF